MNGRRVLLALSADFGEYVTANIFSRGQSFEALYSVPRALARYAPPGRGDITAYDDLKDLQGQIVRSRPDIVVLASGYLFPVNRIATPEALRDFVARLRSAGIAIATTDPWLRVFALRPGSKLSIHSVRAGGEDAVLSQKMRELQDYLERLFHGIPHLFAVPLPGRAGECLSFFNPDFVRHGEGEGVGDHGDRDEWLFVLSKEDFTFLAGFGRESFFGALEDRIEELLSWERNQLRFIGPAELGEFLGKRWPRERVAYEAYCDFNTFESAIRRATVVAYWNVLSSSLLYCLYHRVPPIFFGKGHQAQVCEGLFEHAVEHVYRGNPPRLLALEASLTPRADTLIERLGLRRWLDLIGRDYAQLPTPADAIERVVKQHDGE